MLAQIEQPFRAAFDKLLEDEGHTRLADYMTVSTFDEVPLFYRLSHISFLDGLEMSERNKLVIRAAVLHLAEIVNYARKYYAGREDSYLRMVSVIGWWVSDESGLHLNDGTTEMLTPCFWIGNMASPEMQSFTMSRPVSAESEFVMDALGGDSCVRLHEGYSNIAGERYLERVYVELA
jgi:Immunity protein 15